MKYTESQERIIAKAHTMLGMMVIVALMIGIGWLAGKFFLRTASATLPLILGLFLSLVFRPLVDRIDCFIVRRCAFIGRRGWGRSCAVCIFGVLLLALCTLLAVGLYRFGYDAAEQASEIYHSLQAGVDKVADWLVDENSKMRRFLFSVGCGNQVSEFTAGGWDYVGERLSHFVGDEGGIAHELGTGFLRYISSVGSWFMTIVFCAVFLVTDTRSVRAYLDNVESKIPVEIVSSETRKYMRGLLEKFSRIMVNYFGKQMLICVSEGLLFGFALMLAGLPHGFMLGFVQGLMNFIPFVGTVACLPILVLTAYISGGVWMLVGVGIFWSLLQLLDGFLLPTIVHGKTKEYMLEPWLVLFSFMFWGAVFNSVLGMVLAVPMTAFVKSALNPQNSPREKEKQGGKYAEVHQRV